MPVVELHGAGWKIVHDTPGAWRYTLPSGATIEVQRGYIGQQFYQNRYTVRIRYSDPSDGLVRATWYELGPPSTGGLRLIRQAGAGTRMADLDFLRSRGGRMPGSHATWEPLR